MTVLPVLRSQLLEQVIQVGIVERTREHANRLKLQAMNDGVQLPEPEMAGEEQDALALCVGMSRAILAFELDALSHFLVRQGAELEHLEEEPAEVAKHLTCDDVPFRRGPSRKRLGQVGIGDSPVRPIE